MVSVEEKQNGEDGSHDCSNHLYIGSLWKSKEIEEVSSGKKSELIEESCLNRYLIWCSLI